MAAVAAICFLSAPVRAQASATSSSPAPPPAPPPAPTGANTVPSVGALAEEHTIPKAQSGLQWYVPTDAEVSALRPAEPPPPKMDPKLVLELRESIFGFAGHTGRLSGAGNETTLHAIVSAASLELGFYNGGQAWLLGIAFFENNGVKVDAVPRLFVLAPTFELKAYYIANGTAAHGAATLGTEGPGLRYMMCDLVPTCGVYATLRVPSLTGWAIGGDNGFGGALSVGGSIAVGGVF